AADEEKQTIAVRVKEDAEQDLFAGVAIPLASDLPFSSQDLLNVLVQPELEEAATECFAEVPLDGAGAEVLEDFVHRRADRAALARGELVAEPAQDGHRSIGFLVELDRVRRWNHQRALAERSHAYSATARAKVSAAISCEVESSDGESPERPRARLS